MSSANLTREQREVLRALRVWAVEVSNNDWHQQNDSRPQLVPLRPTSDPANWNTMLEKILTRAHADGGEDLALRFADAAWKSRKKAWEAHERGTPDCLECATRANAELQTAIRFFSSTP